MSQVMRGTGALVAGVVAWKLVVELVSLLGRLVWPAYAAVETQRVFSLDMLVSRLAVGALATIVFGVAVALVARADKRTIGLIVGLWLLYSIVDHYLVWDQFPVWYHMSYLVYIVPLALLGAKMVKHKIDHADNRAAMNESAL